MEHKVSIFEVLLKEYGPLRHTGGKYILEDGTVLNLTKEDLDNLVNKYEFKELVLNKRQEIESKYKEIIEQPIKYTVSDTEYNFQADLKSQDTLTKVISAAPDNYELDWLDVDNKFVHLTLADLKGIAGTILERSQKAFMKKTLLKAKVKEASSKEELDKIIWEDKQ